MSMSGITVDDAVATLYNEMKLRHTHRFATFKIEDKKRVVIAETMESTGKGEADMDLTEAFRPLQELANGWFESSTCRYILYDFNFMNETNGRKVSKIAFIFLCPDNAKVGDKMIYASTKDTVKKAFVGLGLEFQATDKSEFDLGEFKAEIIKKS